LQCGITKENGQDLPEIVEENSQEGDRTTNKYIEREKV
jgi:hypothetical protein